jgi:hypothetical protein
MVLKHSSCWQGHGSSFRDNGVVVQIKLMTAHVTNLLLTGRYLISGSGSAPVCCTAQLNVSSLRSWHSLSPGKPAEPAMMFRAPGASWTTAVCALRTWARQSYLSEFNPLLPVR